VKNSSGRDYGVGEAFQIDSYRGPADKYEVEQSPLVNCIEPTWHTAIDKIVIAAEPIPDTEFGIAVVAGVCVIKAPSAGSDSFVMINPSTTYEMKGGGESGIAKVLAEIDTDYVLANFGERQNLWSYELTQDSRAPSATSAKLLNLDGTEYASTITLTDPDGLMDDQVSGDQGFCLQIGNEFYAIQAVCA
jgi:hypothetical protein